jgi:hypothetical protein
MFKNCMVICIKKLINRHGIHPLMSDNNTYICMYVCMYVPTS